MTWLYRQSDGMLTLDGAFIGYGYSGHGAGVNNPGLQNVACIGPAPRGDYAIGPAFTDPGKGPLVMRLSPEPDTEMYSRSGLLIHGDNQAMNKTASEGCIILAHSIRQQIADSDDNDLTVV